MSKRYLYILVCFLAVACATKEVKDPELAYQQQHMQENMKQRLSIFFCTGDVYFRACFDTNPDECVEVVQDNFEDCLPKEMPHPFEGIKAHLYSQKLGKCLGHRYDQVMRDRGKFIGKKNPACKEAMNKVKQKEIEKKKSEEGEVGRLSKVTRQSLLLKSNTHKSFSINSIKIDFIRVVT